GDPAQRSYTRAGDFSFDANGKLVTSDGVGVQGYTATDPTTGSIVTTGQPTDIVVPPGVLRPPIATSQFGTASNLSAAAQPGDTFTASVQLYDSLGTSHVATITYTNTAAGAWDYDITVPAAELPAAAASNSIVKGSLTFDPAGALDKVSVGAAALAPAADVTIPTFTWKSGATSPAITWDLIDKNGVASLSGVADLLRHRERIGAGHHRRVEHQRRRRDRRQLRRRQDGHGRPARAREFQQPWRSREARIESLRRERSRRHREHRHRRQWRPRVADRQLARTIARRHRAGIHADDPGAAGLSGELEKHHRRRRAVSRHAQPQTVDGALRER